MPNPPTYADAIAEVKEWIAYEIESYSHLLENSNDRVTRVFFCGCSMSSMRLMPPATRC